MLTAQQHLELAEKNESFAEIIAGFPQRFPEWEVTALFYSAMHYVSAFLATLGYHPENHHRRNDLVSKFTGIGIDYQDLLSRSIDARYNNVLFTSRRVEQIKTNSFQRVKDEIILRLGNRP